MKGWWWAPTLDRRVAVLAAGFGLGPRVAAGVLAKSLGLELAPWRAGDADRLLQERYRVLFNFGVTGDAVEAFRSDQKIWIDCLLWFRDELPPSALCHDLVLAEAFFTTRAIPGRERILEIKPLFEQLAWTQGDPSLILVSFGGIETPFTEDVHRFELPRAVLSALARAIEGSGRRRQIRCFATRPTIDRLAEDPDLVGVEFYALGRRSFLKALAAAGLYVVQPGLYGPFEAFAAGIPTAICIPMSYTQMWQMEAYLEHGLLAHAAVFDRMRAAAGPIGRDVEMEEALWFARSSDWWQETVASSSRYAEMLQALGDWAEQVIAGSVPSAAATGARLRYVESIRELPSVQEALADVVTPSSW